MEGCKRLSFSQRLGWWKIIRIVWCAIPWQFRLFVFPYCLLVYRRFLTESTNLDEVRSMHIDKCCQSRVFGLFRPRFHLVEKSLLSLVEEFVESEEEDECEESDDFDVPEAMERQTSKKRNSGV
jgi:hypothetical protein